MDSVLESVPLENVTVPFAAREQLNAPPKHFDGDWNSIRIGGAGEFGPVLGRLHMTGVDGPDDEAVAVQVLGNAADTTVTAGVVEMVTDVWVALVLAVWKRALINPKWFVVSLKVSVGGSGISRRLAWRLPARPGVAGSAISPARVPISIERRMRRR